MPDPPVFGPGVSVCAPQTVRSARALPAAAASSSTRAHTYMHKERERTKQRPSCTRGTGPVGAVLWLHLQPAVFLLLLTLWISRSHTAGPADIICKEAFLHGVCTCERVCSTNPAFPVLKTPKHKNHSDQQSLKKREQKNIKQIRINTNKFCSWIFWHIKPK